MQEEIVATKYRVNYRTGRPAGWTDDLGIIADRNQWLKEELPGWYCWISYADREDIRDWCEQKLCGMWELDRDRLYIFRDNEAMFFNMTWG